MDIQALLVASFTALLFSVTQSITFNITNNCPDTIWPATLTGGGGSQLSTTGFELASKASSTVDVKAPWSGRLWARTGCSNDTGTFKCATGNCGSGQVECNGTGGVPPATLLEFTLAAENGQDFYDVSLVDGANLPVSLTPEGGSGNCTATACPVDVKEGCPNELVVKGADGGAIACKSGCAAFNTPQYCCTGSFGTPETCPPTEFSKYFKEKCPQAYSYAYDDKTSTVTCAGGPSYAITFCP